MTARAAKAQRSPVAKRNCRHFAGGALATCARGGLDALEQPHRARIDVPAQCSVHLDQCRQPREPEADRWDYVITLEEDTGIGVEPHPAYADQLDEVIRKKRWAEALLKREAPTLKVAKWVWLTGADAAPGFTPTGAAQRRLAQEGIVGPRRRLS